MLPDVHKASSAYDIVKKYVEEKVGKFTSADVVVHCPSIGRSSVLASLNCTPCQGQIFCYLDTRRQSHMGI